MKIVSLVPSQSELLWHLGLRSELVGITKFCIHPAEMFGTIKRVGGTKTVDLETVRALQPDLIIANKEENERSQIEALQKEFNVHVTDIYTLTDSLGMIRTVGALVDRKSESELLATEISGNFEKLPVPSQRKKVLYLIWKKPFMAAGKNTFIDDMISRAGFENVLGTERYPELSMNEIKKLDPDLVFLSSEPYPFKEKHINEFEATGLKAKVVDGEMFSWYGSRLLEAPAYFTSLLKETN